MYEIDSIVSATQLTLVQDYAGTTNGAVAYKIRHRSIPSNSAMAAAIAQLLALGSDAAPDHSRTLDDSTARLKFYFDSFLAKLAVGAYSGGVLQSLKEALSIDPATGVVSFPNGMKHNNPGFRNRLINGNFDVWQRGTSFTIANGASAYTADRRLISNYTGVSITVAQVNAPAGFLGRFALNITATGVNDGGYVVISRRMEASDLADLDSKTCVFAFDANGSTSVGTIDGYSRFACNSAIDNSSWSVYPGAALFAFPVGSGRIVS
ncbi:MAG: hypothetical protein KDA41_21390, partial [Planctomycetales bacterium]|nr:hypothetical protein [Planctomycetales bacterium]